MMVLLGLIYVFGIALLCFYGNGERFRKQDVDKELEELTANSET